jgi:PilZ domain
MSDTEPLDLLVIERQEDKCIYVSLPGRYSLIESVSPRVESRQFACRAVNISTRTIALTAPVTARVGVRVIADIEQLGRVKGSIFRVFDLGLAMNIEASEQEREVLSTKIDWIERNKDFEICDHRSHARFAPRRPLSLLTLAEGSKVPCFIIDISVSGAAISAGFAPKIGAELAVGSVVGRVVRFVPGGFAVQFIQLQDRQEVESLIIRK